MAQAHKELEFLLTWYADMGVDETIGEATFNHLAPKKEEPVATKPQVNTQAEPPAPPVTAFTNPTGTLRQARALADASNTLEDLRQAVENFDGCALKKTATNTVFADGNPQAPVMLIGEAPGANEDKEGIPFCGASGKLLDKILASIGLTRAKNLYITNNLFWRPPGNRRPTPEELAMCSPFVEKHIALINPTLLILAGSTSASSVLNTTQGVTKLRGKFFDYTNGYLQGKTIPAIVTFHPSYLLRQPSQKRMVWHDMLEVKAFLEEKGVL